MLSVLCILNTKYFTFFCFNKVDKEYLLCFNYHFMWLN